MEKKSSGYVITSGIFFVLGMFLITLCYNWIFLPNHFVVSGLGGIALVLNHVYGINTVTFIYIANFSLLIISYFVLGKEKTKKSALGAILYPLMVSFTSPIADFLNKIYPIDDTYLLILIGFLLYGIGNGLVFKYGFTTGGGDIVMQILNKYLKIPEGQASLVVNTIVIICGALVFGYLKGIYSLLILLLATLFIDKILFGISESKLFFVYTKKYRMVRKVILDEFKAGYTILPTYGGYSHSKGKLIMCVLPNRDYYPFKKRIMEIDPNVFFVIQDCYEVEGGLKRSNFRILSKINKE